MGLEPRAGLPLTCYGKAPPSWRGATTISGMQPGHADRDVTLLRWLDRSAIVTSIAGAVAAGTLLGIWLYDPWSVAWSLALTATWVSITATWMLSRWQRRVRRRVCDRNVARAFMDADGLDHHQV
jgi:hypothetical protein